MSTLADCLNCAHREVLASAALDEAANRGFRWGFLAGLVVEAAFVVAIVAVLWGGLG